jgi:HAE1 family hydrophobic/amphiphilic exporter-1
MRDPETHKMASTSGINLMVMRQPKSNVIEVVNSIRKLIPEFNAQLPPSVSLVVRGDSSKNIREAFSDIQFMMGLTAALVILVIFLFLRNLSATLIPSLALPFSIIGTFGVMYLFNYSLNNLSMMALILSIGFVVDDAIVMLENIVRHMEKGVPPMLAARLGSREISFTIVSMTLSLGAVFIPVLFMGGILGRLFKEFAVTITVAVLISGLVSVTLTPMLCSRLLRGASQEAKHGRFYWAMEWVIRGMTRAYGSSLRLVLRHHYVMAVVFFAVLGATFWLFMKVPKGFIPDQDTDQLSVNTDAAQGTSHYRMIELQKRISEIVAQDPDIEAFSSSAGGSMGPGPGGSNTGRMWITLKPRKERAPVQQIIDRLRPQLAPIPGIRALPSVFQMIRLGGRGSRSAFEFTVQAPEVKDLYRNAQALEREMIKLPSLMDVNSDLQVRNPRLTVKIDRDKAAALGLNVEQIQSALYSAYGPRWVSTIYAPTNQFRVMLELMPEYQTHADLLSLIQFKSGDNRLVPLDSVAKLTMDASPQTIAHSGQLPSVTIAFNLKPGVALGDAVEEVEALAKQTLPANMSTSFTGTAKAFQSSLKNLTVLMIVAIMVVYIVLGVLYESFVQPLTILSGLPSAIFGALLTLTIFNVELNIYSFVGLMMLIGIVKKNAIMQIDFALEAERQHNKGPEEAIFEGCMVRFRPIMMTTLAALFGTLPMAIGYGAGGEARRPLGLAVVGGLIFSQLITLYLTPVVYTYMAGIVTAWNRIMKPRPKAPLAPAVSHVGAD